MVTSLVLAAQLLIGLHDGAERPDSLRDAKEIVPERVYMVEGKDREKYKKDPAVKFVEEDAETFPDRTPNDPRFPEQWHHFKIRSPEAWDRSISASTIVVAVADTGVNSVDDLKGKLVRGFNPADGNAHTDDGCGHGTAVAGTIGAVTDNAFGVASVGWLAKIMPVRIVAENSCSSFISVMAPAVTGAADRGAHIVNMSFSGIHRSATMQEAGRYALERGTIFVASAGNTGRDETWAESPYIIAVASTNRDDTISSFSSRGTFVDIAAPGSGILTTNRDGTFAFWSGTSFSSPIDAGVLALMRSQSSDVGGIIRRHLETAVDLGPLGYDTTFGNGRVDAAAAVGAPAAPTPTRTATPRFSPTPTRTRTPTPVVIRTPTPPPIATRTPTPRPTATRTPTRTRTPTPRPTPTPTPCPRRIDLPFLGRICL